MGVVVPRHQAQALNAPGATWTLEQEVWGLEQFRDPSPKYTEWRQRQNRFRMSDMNSKYKVCIGLLSSEPTVGVTT
jgi:hypothetical protein